MNDINKSTLRPQQLFEILSKYGKEFNINKWDLGASSSSDLSVQVQQGEPKQLKASQRNSITLRVWDRENKVGITSTSDLTNEGIKKAIRGAIEASKFGNKDESPEFSSLAKEPLHEIKNNITKEHGINHLLSILQKAEKELLETHKAIDSVPYNGLSESYMERLYINSDGANRYMELSQASLYLYAKSQEENKKPRSSGTVKINNCIEKAQKNLDA